MRSNRKVCSVNSTISKLVGIYLNFATVCGNLFLLLTKIYRGYISITAYFFYSIFSSWFLQLITIRILYRAFLALYGTNYIQYLCILLLSDVSLWTRIHINKNYQTCLYFPTSGESFLLFPYYLLFTSWQNTETFYTLS